MGTETGAPRVARGRTLAGAVSCALILVALLAADRARRHSRAPEGAATETRTEAWLADFESTDELARWSSRRVVASLARGHATHGDSAVLLRFAGAGRGRFRLEPEPSDWRPYASLDLDLTNAGTTRERLLVQLRDVSGHSYQEEAHLSAGASLHLSLAVADIARYLDPSRIAQFTLFRWKESREAAFYVDAVVLRRHSPHVAAPDRKRAVGIVPRDHWTSAWATSLVKLSRDPGEFAGEEGRAVALSAAKGERESFQVAVVGPRAQSARVRVTVDPLRSDDGARSLPASAVELRRVDYVTTHPPSYPVTRVGEWADPLPLASEVTVAAGGLQPLWVTVAVPQEADAGTYHAAVRLTGSDGRSQTFDLAVRVRDYTLPSTSRLATAFELEVSLLRDAYRRFVPGGSAWEGRWDELVRLYVLDMLQHRISPILNADPGAPGFNEEIAAYRAHGLTGFGIGRHGGNWGNNWPHEPRELEPMMAWYHGAAATLREKGLLDLAYVYAYDEPPPGLPHVARVLSLLHGADPGLRNLLVMHETPDVDRDAAWLRDADILCLRVTAYEPALAAAWRARGKELWLYTASPAQPYPALVVDHPAMSVRILPWICWKLGATGLAQWSINFWRVDPWVDTRDFARDQNLSGTLYYPGPAGPVPSIRLEVLRDGIEDYDALQLLADRIAAARRRGGGGPDLDAAERLAAVDPAVVASARGSTRVPAILLAARDAVADAIERLGAADGER